MIGQTWPSEMREFADEKTGRRVRQLTRLGNNVHLYFTENSFDQRRNEIIFLSDRASGVDCAPHEAPAYNLFRLNLDTGLITQLTDETGKRSGGVTKTPDSRQVVFCVKNKIKQLDTETGAVTTVYTETGGYTLGAPSIASNRRYVAFCRNEDVAVERGPNYAGFREQFQRIKDGRITLAYLDGSGWLDVCQDTHWIGHFQFCPDDSTLGSYCHEGPWHLVTQRMWLFDFVARLARPCFRQTEQDAVGHEFWTRDGHLFFDNRGAGHDGTITSSRTQAVAAPVAGAPAPFVGLADRRGQLVWRMDMPYYCNHYHANPDRTWLVGDAVDDLVLIDISGAAPQLVTLCQPHTSWHTQSSHCHPTWSWDGQRILYASDAGGRVNLYLIEPVF
jgi:oligogalacturonide lyase